VFEGFLPRTGSVRSERLAALVAERRTIVLYEAPHRLARTLADLTGALGPDRAVVVARELTKLHEEVWRGTLAEAAARPSEVEPRGEHVLVVAGAPAAATVNDEAVLEALSPLLAAGVPTKSAAEQVASRLGVSRNRAYALAVRR
jgi:16S rRNA (cytidine1402-2'-O)-methyltransferase